MTSLANGTVLTVRRDGDQWGLSTPGGDVGDVRGNRLEVGGLVATLGTAGTRRVLHSDPRTRVLRLDPAGGKATWLTLAGDRFRLARQRPRPLLRRWVLTRDVTGAPVLRVHQTPLGVRVTLDDVAGLHEREVETLVAGVLAEVLDLAAAGLSAA